MVDFIDIPTDGIIFIDTSATDYEGGWIQEKKVYDQDRADRILKFRRLLENQNNWLSIPEVAAEILEGIKGTEDYIQRLREERSSLGNLVSINKERQRILQMIKERNASSPDVLTPDLISRVNQLFPQVNEIFLANKGETNDYLTDQKLVTYAAAYAETANPRDPFVYLWSEDRPMLKTFKAIANKLDLRNTATLTQEGKRIIPCVTAHSLREYREKQRAAS